jgi:hypothetical protein
MTPNNYIVLAVIAGWFVTAGVSVYLGHGIARAKRGFGWRARDEVSRLKQIRDWLFYLFVGFLFVCLTMLWVIEAGTPDRHRPNPPTEVETS